MFRSAVALDNLQILDEGLLPEQEKRATHENGGDKNTSKKTAPGAMQQEHKMRERQILKLEAKHARPDSGRNFLSFFLCQHVASHNVKNNDRAVTIEKRRLYTEVT